MKHACPTTAIFKKNIVILTLTDDLDLGTKEQVLPTEKMCEI